MARLSQRYLAGQQRQRQRQRPVAERLPGRLARTAHVCHAAAMDATLVLGQQGRLVIPAEVRTALGLAPGDRLHLHISGQRLVLERQQDAAAELRGLAASIPRSRSLVEELLAERRVAAASE
jgi:antitoxin PrlF